MLLQKSNVSNSLVINWVRLRNIMVGMTSDTKKIYLEDLIRDVGRMSIAEVPVIVDELRKMKAEIK